MWNVYIDGNAEIEHEVGFERLMLSIGEHTNKDLDTITVFGFYALIDHIKEKNKANG